MPPPLPSPTAAGKSTLLVALLHFLLLQRARAGSPLAGARVLVSAHTNVAVDRVLLGGWMVVWVLGSESGGRLYLCARLRPFLPSTHPHSPPTRQPTHK